MNIENKAWWRGSFPSWIVAALLGLICWLGVRLVNEHDEMVRRTFSNTDRIMALEFSSRQHLEQMQELKSINSGIQDKLEKLREDLRSISRLRLPTTPSKTTP